MLRFVLLFSLMPVCAVAQSDIAAWASNAAQHDFSTFHLRNLRDSPLGSDSIEVRIWQDVALTRDESMVRAYRFAGTWHAERWRTHPLGSETLPDTIDWARRWARAIEAGLDSLPVRPDRRPNVPVDDGDSIVIEWSNRGETHEAVADNPEVCFAVSDRVFIQVLGALTARPSHCNP